MDVRQNNVMNLDSVNEQLEVSEFAWEMATFTEDLLVFQNEMKK